MKVRELGAGVSLVVGSEFRFHTLHFDGRTERHIENCCCTTKAVWWPCEVKP